MHGAIVIDTREQKPYEFAGLLSVRAKLDVGDYSLAGFEHRIAIERKSMTDFLSTVTHGRARFEKELKAMRRYELAAIVVEEHLDTVINGTWTCPSGANPNSVLGSLVSFSLYYGVHTFFAGDRTGGEVITTKLLTLYGNRVERDWKKLVRGKLAPAVTE